MRLLTIAAEDLVFGRLIAATECTLPVHAPSSHNLGIVHRLQCRCAAVEPDPWTAGRRDYCAGAAPVGMRRAWPTCSF